MHNYSYMIYRYAYSIMYHTSYRYAYPHPAGPAHAQPAIFKCNFKHIRLLIHQNFMTNILVWSTNYYLALFIS